MKTETIAAIATGLTNAGISIIRISGEAAFSIIDKIYKSKSGNKKLSKESSHTVHYGFIMDNELVIDEVMVLIMRAPSTYTREDVIEINCHGGIVVTRKILQSVLKHGARMAEPGEFTKRAFLNGRIDLSRAEAVSDLINAKNEMSLTSAMNQLRGKQHDQISLLRETILRDIAFIEAALDDPEHMSLDGFDDILNKHLKDLMEKIEKLIKDSQNGKIIREGIRTVILGKPNAGKSSLLNSLMGEERAIVTDIAGTTRDTLEETIQFGGITLNIIDTAGIRNTEDLVEQMGVEKAKRFAKSADLIIFVVDSSTKLDINDNEIIDLIQDKKSIILLNKSDLIPMITIDELNMRIKAPILNISLKENVGMDELEALIKELFFQGKLSINDELMIVNDRQRESLMGALESLKAVKNSIDAGVSEDFYSIDLMGAYEELGDIIGENVEEDLVNMIFKEFCMGK